MAKKKTGAKKVARKTTKMSAPKPLAKPKSPMQPKPPVKPPEKPKLTESKVAPSVAPPKPKPIPPKVTLAAKKKVEPKGSRGDWPGKDKGYPDPFHVEKEYVTAKDRIFVLKKDAYIYKIYKARKMIFPLDPTD